MVDMRDDAKVAGILDGHEGAEISGSVVAWSMPVFGRVFKLANAWFWVSGKAVRNGKT
jgi:hypothetical protein